MLNNTRLIVIRSATAPVCEREHKQRYESRYRMFDRVYRVRGWGLSVELSILEWYEWFDKTRQNEIIILLSDYAGCTKVISHDLENTPSYLYRLQMCLRA